MATNTPKSELNLWMAFTDESKTYRMYTAYAQQAMREGNYGAAEAFMEAAGSEVVHALAALRALGAVKSSAENLRAVIDEEAREAESTYPRYIAEAREEGREDAEAVFRLALARERYHVGLFKRALAQLGPTERLPSDGEPSPWAAPARSTVATEDEMPSVARTASGGLEKMSGPAELGEERERIASRSRIRELVFGAQDGVLTTVGVVSSIFGATESKVIILLAGIASGFAGMVAMTAGSYLSSKAEMEVHRSEVLRERREMTEHPAEELAELIEIYRRQGMTLERARDTAINIAKRPRKMLEVMAQEELGLDVTPKGNPGKDAVVMAFSFLIGAVIPIAPYVFITGVPALITSVVLASLALFGIGVIKARVVESSQWRSGLEAFAIGASAALVGYVLGTLVPKAFGVNLVGI